MNNEQLKNYLEKRLANCNKEREKNIAKNHGLGGNYLVTEQGKVNDAFLRGKIQIISDTLARLETPTEQEQKVSQAEATKMGQYEKTRAMIYQLEKEIADLKKQAEEIADSIAIREQQKAECIAYLKELDAMDNTDPEHRGDDAYY